jgi:hypothetical protein
MVFKMELTIRRVETNDYILLSFIDIGYMYIENKRSV